MASRLHKERLVSSPSILSILGFLKGFKGYVPRGEYVFYSSMSPIECYKIIDEGVVNYYSLTIKPGYNKYNITIKLPFESIKIINFIKEIYNKELLLKYNIKAPSMEGYLGPGLIHFSKAILPKRMIEKMYVSHLAQWNKIIKNRGIDALKKHEIMTLASILTYQKVSLKKSESFIRNIKDKINNNKKLRLISTARYATGTLKGKIPDNIENFKSPYNTFYKFGLPAGPICTPSEKYLKLVLHYW